MTQEPSSGHLLKAESVRCTGTGVWVAGVSAAMEDMLEVYMRPSDARLRQVCFDEGGKQHALRFEFEPTGPAEPLKGRGIPGNTKLLIDGEAASGGIRSPRRPLNAR